MRDQRNISLYRGKKVIKEPLLTVLTLRIYAKYNYLSFGRLDGLLFFSGSSACLNSSISPSSS